MGIAAGKNFSKVVELEGGWLLGGNGKRVREGGKERKKEWMNALVIEVEGGRMCRRPTDGLGKR